MSASNPQQQQQLARIFSIPLVPYNSDNCSPGFTLSILRKGQNDGDQNEFVKIQDKKPFLIVDGSSFSYKGEFNDEKISSSLGNRDRGQDIVTVSYKNPANGVAKKIITGTSPKIKAFFAESGSKSTPKYVQSVYCVVNFGTTEERKLELVCLKLSGMAYASYLTSLTAALKTFSVNDPSSLMMSVNGTREVEGQKGKKFPVPIFDFSLRPEKLNDVVVEHDIELQKMLDEYYQIIQQSLPTVAAEPQHQQEVVPVVDDLPF